MQRFLNALLVIETLVASLLFALAATILFLDVVMRELFQTPIWGGQRMAVLLSNGAALIGLAVAAALNRHLRPAVLDHVFPDRFAPYIVHVGHLVSAAVLLAGAYFAFQLLSENRALGFTAPPLKIPIWIPQIALVYGLGASALRYLCFAIDPDLMPRSSEAP